MLGYDTWLGVIITFAMKSFIRLEAMSVWVILQAAERKARLISTVTCSLMSSLKYKQFSASQCIFQTRNELRARREWNTMWV